MAIQQELLRGSSLAQHQSCRAQVTGLALASSMRHCLVSVAVVLFYAEPPQ